MVPAKGSYGLEGQLHTVIEKSPESSPTTKPRQGGGFIQPPFPSGHSLRPESSNYQPTSVILPATMHPVLHPELHYARLPASRLIPGASGVYPALDKENKCQYLQGIQGVSKSNEGITEWQNDEKMLTTESSVRNNTYSPYTHSFYLTSPSTQLDTQSHEADR